MRVAEVAGISFAVDRIKEYITGTIEAVANSNILAERVGFSAEAFQKLAYAAKFAHIDSDSLALSLGQMDKRLGEVAISGTGPAADALKRFGLTAQQLVAMGPEKAFYTLLDVMSRIQNPMERAAVAMDLFGKSGQSMVNLMAQGSPALKALGEEASRMGVALNAIDNAKIMEAEEAMIQLQAAATGFSNQLIVTLAPYLTLLVKRFEELEYGGKRSANFIAQGVDIITNALGFAIDATNRFKAVWYGVQSAINGVLATIFDGLTKLNDTLGKLAPIARGALGPIGLLGSLEGTGAIAEDLHKLAAEEAKKAAEAAGKVGGGHKTAREFLDEINKEANRLAKLRAGKAKDFIRPGEITGKESEKLFGGASEFGSKEAFSTIVQSKFGQTDAQAQIAKNTAEAAEAGKQSVIALKAINDALQKGGAAGNLAANMGKI
jgi:hypothetical protein